MPNSIHQGGYIIDGAVMLHEIVHDLRTKGEKGVMLKLDFEKVYNSVRWDFMKEVMTRKNFCSKLNGWIMSTIKGGKVCININGENNPYFKTQGVEAGGPSVRADVQSGSRCASLYSEQSQSAGYIKGVVPHLIEGGITHLQYADDTVIMMEGDAESIKNVKFLLYCIEWMTGLKINYHKSEVVTFGYGGDQQEDIANALNCKVGQLPMTYLGFPISDRSLGISAFKHIIDKMRKKLHPWKGKNLTSGGGD